MQELFSKVREENEFLDRYLEFVEETESPRIFHVWCALAGIGACLGRRIYLQFGPKPLFANLYAILVGPPASRKSTAMDIMQDLLQSSTRVRFAPDDTNGQRQGMIKSFNEFAEENDDEDRDILNGVDIANGISVEALSQIDMGKLPDSRDKQVIVAFADEFSSLIGINNRAMITFLGRVFDGKRYQYQLKSENTVLEHPLLSIIAGTTPTDLSNAMPAEASGQGFMSRIIFIHGNKKYKELDDPPLLPVVLKKNIKKELHYFSYEAAGEFSKHKAAVDLLKIIYGKDINLNDTRFVYYQERRFTHIQKIAMILAISRHSNIITDKDVLLADAILSTTEIHMPDALGEYGLSPIASAKQKMLEFIVASKAPVHKTTIRTLMHRDMKLTDIANSLNDLCSAGKIKEVTTDHGPAYMARPKAIEDIEDILPFLAADEEKKETIQ